MTEIPGSHQTTADQITKLRDAILQQILICAAQMQTDGEELKFYEFQVTAKVRDFGIVAQVYMHKFQEPSEDSPQETAPLKIVHDDGSYSADKVAKNWD